VPPGSPQPHAVMGLSGGAIAVFALCTHSGLAVGAIQPPMPAMHLFDSHAAFHHLKSSSLRAFSSPCCSLFSVMVLSRVFCIKKIRELDESAEVASFSCIDFF
jgi:hypothetical protein